MAGVGLFAKRDAARKSLDRWLLGRTHAMTDEGRRIAEERIAFWQQRVTDLERLIRGSTDSR